MQSHLCVNSEPYIVVKGSITVTDPNDANYKKKLALKNNAPFIGCLSKINNVLIDNAEDLDVVTPMLNLIEYIKNHSKTPGRFWSYYRDEPNSCIGGENNNYSSKDQNLLIIKQALQKNYRYRYRKYRKKV